MYQLEKYKNPSSRHTCPKCGDKRSFTYYVDENGQMIDKTVGRCNHESGCGYHYTPRQFFQDNPDTQGGCNSAAVAHHDAGTPDFISPDVLLETCSRGVGKNELMFFIWRLFDRHKTEWEETKTFKLSTEYCIGTSGHDTIFWQVDVNRKIRTGKIMKYGDNGHRVKDGFGVDWVHTKLKKKNLLSDGFNMVQCLFGEHLLSKYPQKPVAVVESEKTALLGAACLDKYVWVATGGKSSGITEKFKVLKGRNVVLFPDVDGYSEWQEVARSMTYCNSVKVSDFLMCEKSRSRLDDVARIAEVEDKGKIDIGDWIVYDKRTRSPTGEDVLNLMIEKNPCLKILTNELDLKVEQ